MFCCAEHEGKSAAPNCGHSMPRLTALLPRFLLQFLLVLFSLVDLSSGIYYSPYPLPQCTWKPDPGPCRAFFRRFYYNQFTHVRTPHFLLSSSPPIPLFSQTLFFSHTISSSVKSLSTVAAAAVSHFEQVSNVKWPIVTLSHKVLYPLLSLLPIP